MMTLLSSSLAFILTLGSPTSVTPPTLDIGPVAASASPLTSDLADFLGTALVIFCRPSSLNHGITMLDHSFSRDGDFFSLSARFRWFGVFTKDPYISKIQIEVHAGEKLRITSVEYDDDCLTPCELCKKLGDAKAFLNRKLAER